MGNFATETNDFRCVEDLSNRLKEDAIDLKGQIVVIMHKLLIMEKAILSGISPAISMYWYDLDTEEASVKELVNFWNGWLG